MRDPARIPQVLAAIERVWEKSPDMRLGQILVCALPQSLDSAQLFNVEDDRLVAAIENFDSRHKSS